MLKGFLKRALLLPSLLMTTSLSPAKTYLKAPKGISIQQFLKKMGLNPAIAGMLAPKKKIRVVASTNNYASSQPDWFLYNDQVDCILRVNKPEASFSKPELSKDLNIAEEDLADIPLSKKELVARTVMHEIRHCSKENYDLTWKEPMISEADADYHAVTTAAQIFNNPEIIRFIFNWRAATPPNRYSSHDVALYLDAKYNDKPIPDTASIDRANLEVEKSLAGEKISLSPLAQRRMDLYNEAQRYFRKGR